MQNRENKIRFPIVIKLPLAAIFTALLLLAFVSRGAEATYNDHNNGTGANTCEKGAPYECYLHNSNYDMVLGGDHNGCFNVYDEWVCPPEVEENTDSSTTNDTESQDTATSNEQTSNNASSTNTNTTNSPNIAGAINYSSQEDTNQTTQPAPNSNNKSDQGQLDNLLAQGKPGAEKTEETDDSSLNPTKSYAYYLLLAPLILGSLGSWYLIKKRKIFK